MFLARQTDQRGFRERSLWIEMGRIERQTGRPGADRPEVPPAVSETKCCENLAPRACFDDGLGQLPIRPTPLAGEV
jgi:hypothetical protein